MSKRNDCGGKESEKNYQWKEKRKPYTKPKLTNFGNIEKLTQGATGQRNDGIPHGKMP
jgi:hypothetical protein